MIIVWSTDLQEGVSITEDGIAPDDTTTPQAVVTVTKPAGSENPVVVKLVLSVTLEGVGTVQDFTTVDVYDNSCIAAEAVGKEVPFDPADFNKDCVVGVDDLAVLAAAWLYDYSLVDP